MGKKGGWFSAVKRALSPFDSKGKKDKKPYNKSWFGNPKSLDADSTQSEAALANPAPHSTTPTDKAKLTKAENEQRKHAHSVAYATAVAAEAAVAAAHSAADVVRLTSRADFSGKSKEEIAAIKIQAAYRGHLARRTLRAVRGLGRLKSLIQGQSVKRQATSTLRCMQTLARVQSQVRSRRIRMSEENQALQRHVLQKREKEADNARASLGNTWDDSTKSKEEVEASLQSKQEAAVRRERALAYAHTHQQAWRNSSKSANPTFMDPNNPHWGWSWLERWMAARPWETQSTIDGELNNDHTSIKSVPRSTSAGDMRKRVNRHSKSPSDRRLVASQKGSVDDDTRSFQSAQSERNRRRSVHDDESSDSSPQIRSYMSSTKSTKARSRMTSPSPLGSGKKGAPEKGPVEGSAKKRLSFSGSPRTDSNSVKGAKNL